MLTFGPKINRSFTMYMPFSDTHTEVTVMFNKTNTYLGFNTDERTYQRHKRNEIYSHIFKDLNKSSFATTFLDIQNFRSRNLDIKQQFDNINERFRDKIQYKANETLKLSKVKTNGGEFDSLLYIYVFSVIDYDSEFLFFLAERQHIDVALDKKVVRTCALQLCSKDTYEDFTETVEHYNTKHLEEESVDKVMRDALNPDRRKERFYDRKT